MVAPREAKATVRFIDEYCQAYRNIFPEVRSFEAFKNIHAGMVSEIKRKSLRGIAKELGLSNYQGLHHFVTKSPWSAQELRKRRLEIILRVVKGRKIIVIIDDTGEKKRGNKTEYTKRQRIGNLGKIENGIVSVTAYGVVDNMTFPLMFEVYKPKEKLKEGDQFKTKPEIASEMLQELWSMGLEIELVLADSLYGESESSFISSLEELNLDYVLAVRSNHGGFISISQEAEYSEWKECERTFSNGRKEKRYIREITSRVGKRGEKRKYWHITTDREKLPPNTTCYIMTRNEDRLAQEIGDLYGLRNWVEYGLKQSKNELGWADFQFVRYEDIQKWWELVCSTYTMVSLTSQQLEVADNEFVNSQKKKATNILSEHPQWNHETGWKNQLNNLRLIMEPWCCLNKLKLWLLVFPIRGLFEAMDKLIEFMNIFPGVVPTTANLWEHHFSSA